MPSTATCRSLYLRMGHWILCFLSLQLIQAATSVSVSAGAFQMQWSHSSLGSQHAHLLQYRPTVFEATRYHQPSSSGTWRSCRSRSSSSSASSSVSRTRHVRSHLSVHSPLHDAECCTPPCLTTVHRHHDDVDSRHPKYTAPSSTDLTGGPFHSSSSHSHGNKSVHLSFTCHTALINSSFLHFMTFLCWNKFFITYDSIIFFLIWLNDYFAHNFLIKFILNRKSSSVY